MRRRFFNIYQSFPYFAPYWAPKGASPLFEQIWISMPKHVSYRVWLKSV